LRRAERSDCGDELPEFWQSGEAGSDVAIFAAIDGIGEACTRWHADYRRNVSFYNETLGKSIYPTPVMEVLGFWKIIACGEDCVSQCGAT